MAQNDEIIRKRFDELEQIFEKLPKQRSDRGEFYIPISSKAAAYQWGVSSKNLLASLFGKNSTFFEDFERNFTKFSGGEMDDDLCYAVFKAAKDSYINGYIFDQQSIIEANILGSAIEQAEALFNKGYIQAAAIVAGVSLETRLRSMCDNIHITYELEKATIHSYNSALYKEKKYTQPQMHEIATWGDIRNAAAHGKWGEFTKEQVDLMIKGITRFLANYHL